MASQAGEQHVQLMAEMAVEETGMGRVADKYAKNVVQARGTPGVECLQPQVLTGDRGLGCGGFGNAVHQPGGHGDQQRHQHDCSGQQRGVRAPSGG